MKENFSVSTSKSAQIRIGLAAAWFGVFFKRTAAILVLCLIWEIIPRTGVVNSTFLPPISRVLDTLWKMLDDGSMAKHIEVSLFRALSGFLLAVLCALPVGLLIGWYRKLAEFINPVLEIFRNTAPLALLPVFTLILGIGEMSKVTIIIFSCFWPILLNTISGVKNVDPLLIKSARSMGLSPAQLFVKVVIPASLPTIFTGIRLAGASSILVLIAAEMVGAKAGLGFFVNSAQYSFMIPEMYAGIITLSFMGVAFNYILIAIERRMTAWRL